MIREDWPEPLTDEARVQLRQRAIARKRVRDRGRPTALTSQPAPSWLSPPPRTPDDPDTAS